MKCRRNTLGTISRDVSYQNSRAMEELRAPASGAAHAGHDESPPSGSGSGDGNDVSAFASPEFDPVAFLNRLFPDESSLAGVDPLVQKLRLRVRRVDDEILAAVRSQSTGGARASGSSPTRVLARTQGVRTVLLREISTERRSDVNCAFFRVSRT